MLVPRLVRRSALPDAPKATAAAVHPNGNNAPGSPAGCGPQCIMLIAGAAAGVLLAVLLVLGVLIYRRRRAQEEDDDALAEMEDDWRFQPRTMSVSAQGAARKFSTRSARKPSLAQNVGGAAPWSAGGGGYGPSYGGASPVMLNSPLGRGPRPSLGASDSLNLPRRPSRADLAQMEVYRKMSVIGIV